MTAAHVVAGRDGAPLPAGTRRGRGSAASSRHCVADAGVPARQGPHGLGQPRGRRPGSARRTRTLDLGVRAGDLDDVRGTCVAVSRVVAADGHLEVGDIVPRPARGHDRGDAARRRDLRPRGRASATSCSTRHSPGATRQRPTPRSSWPTRRWSLDALAPRAASGHAGPDPRRSTSARCARSAQSGAWGVWLIIGLVDRCSPRSRWSTRRRWPPPSAAASSPRSACSAGRAGQAIRMVALELAPIVAVGLAAGAVVAAIAVMGVPEGVRGIELDRVRDARGRAGGGRRAARPRRRRRDRPQGDPRRRPRRRCGSQE